MISAEQLSQVFVEVADTLVDDFDLIDFLQNLVDRAAGVSGAEAVGLMLEAPGGKLRFMAASNPTGRMLELLQIQTAEGPCVDCYRTGQPVVNADLDHARDRWPTFTPAALAAGFQSVHAFPLRLRREILGALNLFGHQHIAFDEDDVRIVQALADVATIALLQERNIARSDELTEQLQFALNSRIVIEQAKGALAQADGITLDEAFQRLRTRARSSRNKLVDVAQAYLEQAQRQGRATSDEDDAT
jgi:GAF domain-containing protein